jgi:hypothetical protein
MKAGATTGEPVFITSDDEEFVFQAVQKRSWQGALEGKGKIVDDLFSTGLDGEASERPTCWTPTLGSSERSAARCPSWRKEPSPNLPTLWPSRTFLFVKRPNWWSWAAGIVGAALGVLPAGDHPQK